MCSHCEHVLVFPLDEGESIVAEECSELRMILQFSGILWPTEHKELQSEYILVYEKEQSKRKND